MESRNNKTNCCDGGSEHRSNRWKRWRCIILAGWKSAANRGNSCYKAKSSNTIGYEQCWKRYCDSKSGVLRTTLVRSETNMSITPQSCGTETSTLQSISVWFDGGKKMRPLTILTCVWQRSHLKRGTLYAGVLAALRSISTKKYDGFADTQALKMFRTSKARAASQRHTEHGHLQITSILDTCLHTNVNELIHAHPPRETVWSRL